MGFYKYISFSFLIPTYRTLTKIGFDLVVATNHPVRRIVPTSFFKRFRKKLPRTKFINGPWKADNILFLFLTTSDFGTKQAIMDYSKYELDSKYVFHSKNYLIIIMVWYLSIISENDDRYPWWEIFINLIQVGWRRLLHWSLKIGTC